MVAVTDVIKKMRAEGMTREQIIESLSELGFPNAEALYDKHTGAAPAAFAAPKPTAPTPKPFGLAEAAEKEEKETEKEKEAENEEEAGTRAGGGEEKPLFGQQTPRKQEREEEKNEKEGNEGEKETEVKETGEKEAEEKEAPQTEELPGLNITQVGDDGLEKTVSIEDMLTKASDGTGGAGATQNAGGSGGASASIAAAAVSDRSLRAKLEETNALLRALADVNKKILETDREVLMRLKAKEKQADQQPAK